MKIGFRNSIALELVFLVLGGTSLIFGLVFGYNYTRSRESILVSSEDYARTLTLSVARRVDQEFRVVAKIPQSLACFMESGACNNEELLGTLRRLVESNHEIYGSAVAFEPFAFNKSEKAYAPYFCRSTDGLKFVQLADAYNYFQSDWYYLPKELKKPVWAEPYFDEGGGGILMTTYSFPLSDNDAKDKQSVKAVIGADLSLEWLSKLINSIRPARTGYCFIISDTGAFVAHPRPEFITRESIFSLAEEMNDPNLRRIGQAMIREKRGFMECGPSLAGCEAFVAFARIESPRWSLGAIFPKKELFAGIEDLRDRTLLLGGLAFALLLAVSLLVAGSIARPLRGMVEATERVTRGDLNVDLSHIKRKDEVGQLARSFDQMIQGLRDRDFIRDTFGRYLTHEVVNRLLESKDGLKLGGDSRDLSMIMSDLRGFTALTQNMNAEQVISFLNRYLGKMVDILSEYRGTIDEIIGDGILAFFGAPEPMPQHAERAVACALAMQNAMEEINALHEADGLPRLEMGIAVNTGIVVVGNIGSERRSKYGAVGSQVNFTGRMESFTLGGQVLISRSTYDRVSGMIEVDNVLKVEMKGVPGIVELFEVRGIKGDYNIHLAEKKEDVFVQLSEPVAILLDRVSDKAISEKANKAWITHLSRSSARMNVNCELRQWENVRLVFPGQNEMYGKTVDVKKSDAETEVVIHFTSVSPAIYKLFPEIFTTPKC